MTGTHETHDDLCRWRQLSGFEASSSDEESGRPDTTVLGKQHVGRVEVEGDILYHSLRDRRRLAIYHEAQKGLSFQIWPSALSLAAYAEEKADEMPGCWKAVPAVKGRTVIELGSGCGLAGLVFAALGARVALTDLPETMELLAKNIAFNKDAIAEGGGTAACFPLIWGAGRESLASEWQSADLVIAADVIYHKHLFAPLLTTLQSLVLSKTEIILAHVRRWKDDKLFFAAAKKHFLVEDMGMQAGLTAHDTLPSSSRARGALRLYSLKSDRLPQSNSACNQI